MNYAACVSLIENELKQIKYKNNIEGLYEPVEYTLSLGGKRLRPALMLLSHLLYKESIEKIISPALAIEVFHNFTLLHDDIMDKALKRRNNDTVHIKWNENTAILSGDAMLILAYSYIAKTEPVYLGEVLEIFTKTSLEVCEGQQLDMNFESRSEVSIDDYLEMIRLKTAVLLAASLSIGALTAGASQNDIQQLYQLGIQLGLAFQLQDDYLDVFADGKKFGKSIGGDIVANKKTILLLYALKYANEEQRNTLQLWLNKSEFTDTVKIAVFTEIYGQLNIEAKTKILIDKYYSQALSLMDSLTVPENKKSELIKLITSTVNRES